MEGKKNTKSRTKNNQRQGEVADDVSSHELDASIQEMTGDIQEKKSDFVERGQSHSFGVGTNLVKPIRHSLQPLESSTIENIFSKPSEAYLDKGDCTFLINSDLKSHGLNRSHEKPSKVNYDFMNGGSPKAVSKRSSFENNFAQKSWSDISFQPKSIGVCSTTSDREGYRKRIEEGEETDFLKQERMALGMLSIGDKGMDGDYNFRSRRSEEIGKPGQPYIQHPKFNDAEDTRNCGTNQEEIQTFLSREINVNGHCNVGAKDHDLTLNDTSFKIGGTNTGAASDQPLDLHIALVRERSRVQTLRDQLSQLEEVTAMQDVNEAGTRAELKRLRNANSELVLQVSTLQGMVEKLENERRQLTSRLGALQTAVQQLEREAAIRTRVQWDMAAVTARGNAKGWLNWGSKDPVAEAAAIAEDARVQKAAATVMMEKLVDENADLVEQLNEQSALIERLARTYGNLAHRSDWEIRAGEASLAPKEDPQSPERMWGNDAESGSEGVSRKTLWRALSTPAAQSSVRVVRERQSETETEFRANVMFTKNAVDFINDSRLVVPECDSNSVSPSMTRSGFREPGSGHGKLSRRNSSSDNDGGGDFRIGLSQDSSISRIFLDRGSHGTYEENVKDLSDPVAVPTHSPNGGGDPGFPPRRPLTPGAPKSRLSPKAAYSQKDGPPGVRYAVVSSPKPPTTFQGKGENGRIIFSNNRGVYGKRRSSHRKAVSSEASVVGSPFQFISFIASYISGADLVGKDLGNRWE